MKVTAIEPSGNLYGSEYCLLDIIEGTSPGIDWDVVLPAGGGFDGLLDARGIRSKHLLRRNSHTIPLPKKLGSYLALRRFLSVAHPDIVYLNQAGMLRATKAIARGLGIPIVCQVQTLEDARFLAAHATEHRGVTSFICNSRFIAAHAKLPADKVSVLYQPVMPRNLRECGEKRPPSPPWRVAILGRISETKGHYVFLEAARRLHLAGRNDIEFVVIGEGLSEKDTLQFENAVRSAGVEGIFDLRGYRNDPYAELMGVHMVVIPSPAEPLGRVFLDSAVTATPTIASDSGGLGEFSHHFSLGKRFEPGNPEALAASITQVIDRYPAELSSFRETAKSALKRLDSQSYIATVETILNETARGQSSAIEWLGNAA